MKLSFMRMEEENGQDGRGGREETKISLNVFVWEMFAISKMKVTLFPSLSFNLTNLTDHEKSHFISFCLSSAKWKMSRKRRRTSSQLDGK